MPAEQLGALEKKCIGSRGKVCNMRVTFYSTVSIQTLKTQAGDHRADPVELSVFNSAFDRLCPLEADATWIILINYRRLKLLTFFTVMDILL